MNQSAEVVSASETCANCGSPSPSMRTEKETFNYGTGKNAVELAIDVKVYKCTDCSEEFTSDDAEDQRHDAVCKHLRVLTPAEIRDLRSSLNLSRSEFARLTRIGDATIARWERGSLIQNAGYDQLLRLLRVSENVDRLRTNAEGASVAPTNIARFRYLSRTPELDEARKRFRLQKSARF